MCHHFIHFYLDLTAFLNRLSNRQVIQSPLVYPLLTNRSPNAAAGNSIPDDPSCRGAIPKRPTVTFEDDKQNKSNKTDECTFNEDDPDRESLTENTVAIFVLTFAKLLNFPTEYRIFQYEKRS